MMSTLLGLIASVFVLVGVLFMLVGSLGLVRLPDVFARLHAPTKATTLGVGGLLVGSVFYFASLGKLSVHELLVAGFLLLTAPVSAHLMARAARHRGTTTDAAKPRAPK